MVVKKKSKSPPILSNEFIIQNHADILSCVLMVFIVTLYFQSTAKFGTLFITLNHNQTINKTSDGYSYQDYNSSYTIGPKDFCFVFFYLITMIIYHAVIQEYILDKSHRKLHLSKVKTNKFNESGGLLAFYLPFLFFGFYILSHGFIKSLNSLWIDYPTQVLPWNVKLFFLLQIASWLHFLPEIYFQKVPKEEWKNRLIYIIFYSLFIIAAYTMSFTKIALALLLIQYFEQSVFHVSRIIYFIGKSKHGYYLWNVVFILSRLLSCVLLVLTFQIGLSKSSISMIDTKSRNFNTTLIRRNVLATFGILQIWLLWNFLNFHLGKRREELTQAQHHSSQTKAVKHSSTNKVGAVGFVDSIMRSLFGSPLLGRGAPIAKSQLNKHPLRSSKNAPNASKSVTTGLSKISLLNQDVSSAANGTLTLRKKKQPENGVNPVKVQTVSQSSSKKKN